MSREILNKYPQSVLNMVKKFVKKLKTMVLGFMPTKDVPGISAQVHNTKLMIRYFPR